MRPENRRIKSKRAAVSRGRMYLKANLNWLHGFPASSGEGYVDWLSVPMAGEVSAKRINLTGEHLHNATYTYNKLINNFPRALSGIVENKDLWCERVPVLLNVLKESVHGNKKFPDSTTSIRNSFPEKTLKAKDRLLSEHGELAPVVNVFSWLTFIYPENFLIAINWLYENHRAVKEIYKNDKDFGILSIVVLFRLYQSEGTKRCEKLVSFLGNGEIFRIITGNPEYLPKELSLLNKLKKGKKPDGVPEKPEPDFGKKLLDFAIFLYGANRSVRRKALKLFSLLIPDDFVSNCAEFWQKVFPLIEKSRRIPLGSDFVVIKKNAGKTYNELLEIIKNQPSDLNPGQLFLNIIKISDRKDSDLYNKTLPVLSKLPQSVKGRLTRPAFLSVILELDGYYSNGAMILSPFKQFLSKNSRNLSFLRLGEEKSYYSFFREILYEEKDQKLWPLIFDTMAEVLEYKNNFDFEDTDLLVSLVQVTRSAFVSASYVKQLIDAGKHRLYYSLDQLRCIYLTDKGKNKAGLIAERMFKLDDEDDIDYKSLLKIIRKLEAKGWDNLALEMIEDGKLKVLNTLGKRVSLLEKQSIETDPVELPVPAQIPDWAGNLPEELYETISLLSSLSDAGESRAKRIVSEFIPSKGRIKSEISSLKEKLLKDPANSSLSIRLKNLENSLKKNDEDLSEKRRKKLETKLKRAVRTTVISDWQREVDQKLTSLYGNCFQISADTEFFAEHAELLSGILNLPKSFRETGIELIKMSLNGTLKGTFNLKENEGFIENLRSKGIRTEYWTEKQHSFEIERKGKSPLTISVEENPIEILKMGHYFKTCLSPGSFNFFSAVVNTVDINKQVVFARDKNGKVIGRCLFALTIDGAILTYNPYCHDKGINFNEIMGEFAERLAGKMNTIVAIDGTVPSLVLNEWYDDGATQLSRRYSFLDFDSDFRNSLSKIDTDKFLPELNRLFSPLKLNELTLPVVIEFRELSSRPELILPLLPIIKSCGDLGENIKIRCAKLAYLAGERSYSVHILTKRAEKYLISYDYHYYHQDYDLIGILSEINPSAALRVLRRTRRKGIRKDSEETRPERIDLLTKIHSRLGREFKIKA